MIPPRAMLVLPDENLAIVVLVDFVHKERFAALYLDCHTPTLPATAAPQQGRRVTVTPRIAWVDFVGCACGPTLGNQDLSRCRYSAAHF